MHIAVLLFALCASPIDGPTADRWRPMTAWVSKLPTEITVANQNGQLVFGAKGAGTEIPFTLTLRDSEADGDARYFAVRYRASGLDVSPGNYFLHGWEGTPGGLTFASGDEAVSDGEWHVIVTDLNALRITQPVMQVALKVRVGAGGEGRVEVAGMIFTDELPAGAKVSRVAAPQARVVRVEWPAAPPEPMTGWTTTPAAQYRHEIADGIATFHTSDAGRGMRWRSTLPEPIDLKATPYLSLRYQARGALGLNTYAIWMGDAASGNGQHAILALGTHELKLDGEWHMLVKKLQADFTATHLAVGLECDGAPAELSFGPLSFGSVIPERRLADVLVYAPRQGLPAGFKPLPAATGGRAGETLRRNLGLSDWFAAEDITVGGVPFRVPADPAALRQTGSAEFGEVRLAVPADASEILLLTAAAAPPSEPFGVDAQSPRPIERMDQPEKVFCELRYTQGPPDELLPIDLASGKYGVLRGIAVQAVHPAAGRKPKELVLHDGMQTASFAILGATARTGKPLVAEPTCDINAWQPPASAKLPTVSGPLRTNGGRPLWRSDSAPVAMAEGAVFRVVLDGKPVPDDAWRAERGEDIPGGQRVTLRAAPGLVAVVDVGDPPRMHLAMTLRNESAEKHVATLEFPTVSGVRIGSVADTWYLSGYRSGIINRVPIKRRDPLGQQHPLQCDGFFNPRTGIAFTCLTLDTAGQHHFIRLSKDETGGSWSAEYPDRDLPPGATFTPSPALMAVRSGDWRGILADHRAWLRSWYHPPQAKPWWNRAFAMVDKNAHYDAYADPRDRGALQPVIDRAIKTLGYCDIVHLFGWSSSKQYGDWGDYDHYDETVGGLDYFRGNIAAAQAAGVAISLYQDGYLSCDTGQFAGAHAAEWAIRNRDGKPNFIPVYNAYNQCPSIIPWQDYLSSVYTRIEKDLAPKVLYVDEYGATDGRWVCYGGAAHGHNGYEIPYAGEVAMLKKLRAAVGPEVALFSEYPPAEASREVLDGSITYQALWSADEEELAPHFADLARFAFPAFKQFHILHYAPYRAGNWWPMKFPFFNGETYFIGEPSLPDGYDGPAMAFQRRAVQVLCEHRDAFSSADVEPLVPTLVPGVFANRFSAATETVWTLYNATGRSVRAPVLRVKHLRGTVYRNAWTGRQIEPVVKAGYALLALELGPKGIGCVAAKR